MAVKQPNLEEQEELIDLLNNSKTYITLSNGGKVAITPLLWETQDKINELVVRYERKKKDLQNFPKDSKQQAQLNHITRQFYAQCTAAILLNNFWGLQLLYPFKWRVIYYFAKLTGEDCLKIIATAKKKAQEAEFMMAMTLLLDMTTIWTTMSNKEAEEYRQELLLAKEAQSLKNSHN